MGMACKDEVWGIKRELRAAKRVGFFSTKKKNGVQTRVFIWPDADPNSKITQK